VSGSCTAAEVRLLIQDDELRADMLIPGGQTREKKILELRDGANDRFLDGPATRRLAVVDFDPATGAPLGPPARFVPPKGAGSARGSYAIGRAADSPATLAVNAFGTAFLTIKLFEGEDALGREVTWAFGGEQLLIVPRAGERANAFYDRATRSLQFFWFTGASGDTVYTALSRDIVAHECGHALLDAVVPSLYDSSTPESIAIHEAVADVVAVLLALDSGKLRESVLARSKNTLSGANAFSKIAEQFGMAQLGPGGVHRTELRELANTDTRTTLAGERPHRLSTLLSAIFYDTLKQIYDARFANLMSTPSPETGKLPTADQAANKALGTAYMAFRRLLLRGIDYLPPGELSFADVGRAALAADRAVVSDADAGQERRERRARFAQRFETRGLVTAPEELDSLVPAALDVAPARLPELRDSDYLAYDWVGRNRAAIGIPADVPFTVLPRVDASKKVGGRNDPLQRELILKIGWNHVEKAKMPTGAEKSRLVPTGATIAFHWDTGKCLALVVSDIVGTHHRQDRDAFLAQLTADGVPVDAASRTDGRVSVRADDDYVTLARSHRLLHLEEWGE
jgi:hypothetical protein